MPDTTSVVTAGPVFSADTGAGSGPCSSTTCAFVPPKPNEDTPARRGPWCSGHDELGRERTAVSKMVDRRIPLREVEIRRYVTPLHRQHGLDEPCDPRGRLEVAEVRLHRTQCARRIPASVHSRQGVELDRIAQSGARAVGLDKTHRTGRHISGAQRPGDHVTLCRRIRRGQTVGAAILIDRRAAHHRQHPVPVTHRIGEPLEYHDPGTLTAHETVRPRIEGMTPAARRQHAPLRKCELGFRAQDEIDPAGEGQVALPHPQTLTGQMH